jgi:L,D-transpeptidase YcbB
LRIPILLASVAALSLVGCGDNRNQSASGSAAQAADVSERSLEDQVLAALEDAPRHGLTTDLFLEGDLPGDPSQKRQALLRIANDYASALANGKVDPGEVRDVYTVPRAKVDVEQGVAEALSKNRFREWAGSLAPQSKEYQALSNAFVQLVQRSPDLPDVQIPSGSVIKPGDSDERVPGSAPTCAPRAIFRTISRPKGKTSSSSSRRNSATSTRSRSRRRSSNSRRIPVERWTGSSGRSPSKR